MSAPLTQCDRPHRPLLNLGLITPGLPGSKPGSAAPSGEPNHPSSKNPNSAYQRDRFHQSRAIALAVVLASTSMYLCKLCKLRCPETAWMTRVLSPALASSVIEPRRVE